MTSRVLCVQLADIGDLVLTTPALVALRDAWPSAHITLLTTPHAAPVLPPGLVDEVIPFDKHTFDTPRTLFTATGARELMALWRLVAAAEADIVLFFHHFSTWFGMLKFIGLALAAGAPQRAGLRSQRTLFLNAGVAEEGFGVHHQADYWLRLVASVTGQAASASPVVAIAQPSMLPAPTDGPRVAIHAGSGGYTTARRWEPRYFAAVARQLSQSDAAQVMFVGGPQDDTAAVFDHLEGAPNVTNLTAQTTLPELAGVLATCDLFIGADSGVMHLAAAVGTPIVAVFGPSNHRAWGPYAARHILVRTHPRCAPCSYVGTGVALREGCAARTCIKTVTPEMVLGAARRLLVEDTTPPDARLVPAPPPNRDRVIILGVPVDALTYEAWLQQIGAWVRADDGVHHLCTVNPEFVMIAQRDVNFYHILRRADLCMADGIGLIFAARYLGRPLPGRVTGSDGVPIMAERAAREGWRLYFLGAAEGVAARAADVLRAKHPGLQVVGTFSGSPSPAEEDDLVARINAAGADILLVAYGAPRQDKWIARNAHRLNVKVAMGVGGTFDYITGDVPLAPGWLRRVGLEWLYRLVRQPWRARRQLRLPAFVLAVLLWRQRPLKPHYLQSRP